MEDSLQSRDQLLKIAANFAITREEVLKNEDSTKAAFDIMKLSMRWMLIWMGKRKEDNAPQKKMIKYSEIILAVAESFLNTVAKKLSK